MADSPGSPEAGDHRGRQREHGGSGGTPRWVVIVGIVIGVALLGLIVLLHLSGPVAQASTRREAEPT